jgi:hypothetical protein
MNLLNNLSYPEYLALLLTFTASIDDDYDISEKFMISKKVEFEDLKKAETILKNLTKDEVKKMIKEGFKKFAEDIQKKKKIIKDLEDIINCDGFIHKSEQEILDDLKEIDLQIN